MKFRLEAVECYNKKSDEFGKNVAEVSKKFGLNVKTKRELGDACEGAAPQLEMRTLRKRRNCREALSLCLALALAFAIAACGQSTTVSTLVDGNQKDSVVKPVPQIYEDESEMQDNLIWHSERVPYSIWIDRDGSSVTDVELSCTDIEQMQPLLLKWSNRYGGLSFAGVYDGTNDPALPHVSACFYGLDDATRAREFVSAFDEVDFALSEDGLLDYEGVCDRLRGAGFSTITDLLDEFDEAQQKVDELLDSIE